MRTGGIAAAATTGRINLSTRDAGQAPSPNPGGTANPKSAPAAKPPQQHPSGQTRPRETKGLNERNLMDNSSHARQRPKQSAPGSGEPRKRLKLRSAMHNYVSCLGMTTPPIPPAKGSTAPNAGKKRLFFGV